MAVRNVDMILVRPMTYPAQTPTPTPPPCSVHHGWPAAEGTFVGFRSLKGWRLAGPKEAGVGEGTQWELRGVFLHSPGQACTWPLSNWRRVGRGSPVWRVTGACSAWLAASPESSSTASSVKSLKSPRKCQNIDNESVGTMSGSWSEGTPLRLTSLWWPASVDTDWKLF